MAKHLHIHVPVAKVKDAHTDETTPAYRLARKKFNEATAVFRKAQEKFRDPANRTPKDPVATKKADNEFDAARKLWEQAEKEFDKAEQAEQSRGSAKDSMDPKIAALKPGRSVRLSGDDKKWVTVERSGDGKTLRFVRHTPDGFEVFKTQSWSGAQDASEWEVKQIASALKQNEEDLKKDPNNAGAKSRIAELKKKLAAAQASIKDASAGAISDAKSLLRAIDGAITRHKSGTPTTDDFLQGLSYLEKALQRFNKA